MSSFEKEHNHESSPENQIFMDLTDQITFLFDDAFDRMLENGRGLAEFVQVDNHSLSEQKMYGVLLSENGGKASSGIEQIRILAHKNGDFETIYDAAHSMMIEGTGLAYKTNEYFVAHKSASGEWRYCRIDDFGIYPWLPKLSDVMLGEDTLFSELDFEDIEPSKSDQDPKYVVNEDRLRQLDKLYANELVDKLDSWHFIPNN